MRLSHLQFLLSRLQDFKRALILPNRSSLRPYRAMMFFTPLDEIERKTQCFIVSWMNFIPCTINESQSRVVLYGSES